MDESRRFCIIFTATETHRAEVFSWVYLLCVYGTSHKRKVVSFQVHSPKNRMDVIVGLGHFPFFPEFLRMKCGYGLTGTLKGPH